MTCSCSKSLRFLSTAHPATSNTLPTASYTGMLLSSGGGHLAGDIVDVDQVILTDTVTVVPYFDGSTPDETLYRYDWTGTTNTSTSTHTRIDNYAEVLTALPFTTKRLSGGFALPDHKHADLSPLVHTHTGVQITDLMRIVGAGRPDIPGTAVELREQQAIIGQRLQALEQENQTVEQKLVADTRTVLKPLEDAIAKQAALLGDAATPGSIRQVMGTPEDVAGTTSLRALRSQTNTVVVSAASIKALIGFTISLAHLMVDGEQAGRIVSQQALREAKFTAADFGSSDVGAP